MDPLFVYLIIINAAGLLLMLIDKIKAVNHFYRVPEVILMAVAFLGGSFGSLMGMYLFRHKTNHKKFTVGIPLFLGLQVLIVLLILYK